MDKQTGIFIITGGMTTYPHVTFKGRYLPLYSGILKQIQSLFSQRSSMYRVSNMCFCNPQSALGKGFDLNEVDLF
jgi:hypothetical protein